MRQAIDIPTPDWVSLCYDDNGDRLGRLLSCAEPSSTSNDKHIDLELHELGHKAWVTDRPFPQCSDTQPRCFYPRYNRNLPALAGILRHWAQDWRDHQFLTQILSGGPSPAAAPRRMRKVQRAWRQNSKPEVVFSFVFSHAYRMILVARASTLGGIVKPICFAAFRLITSSNFLGLSMGKSPGFVPLRILST